MITTTNLGRVGLVIHGVWSAGTYVKLDVVRYQNSLYVCNADTTTSIPSTSSDWQLLVTDGSNWLNGSGAPSNTLGQNNDYYFDTIASNIYQKQSGTFSLVTSIKGSAGVVDSSLALFYASASYDSSTSASNSANIALQWATSSSLVQSSDYSAKYYANQSSISASTSANYSSSASTFALNAATSASNAATSATAAATSATAAATSASNAASSATNAATSATAAATSTTAAATSASNAASSATSAANYATSLINSPGTSATSTNTLTISNTASVSLTLAQTGKLFAIGQTISCSNLTGTAIMSGAITAFNSSTRAMTFRSNSSLGSGSYSSWVISIGGLGSVAVTSLPVNSGNGTNISGLLKGSSSTITAATAGVDYSPGTSALATGLLKSTTLTGVLSIATSGADYAPATTGISVLKANGSGGFSSATSGTDYAPATTGTSILKANGSGGFSSATSGTDYQLPIGTFTTLLLKGTGAANTIQQAVAGTDYLLPTGSGSGLTSINASSITSGVLSNGFIASVLSGKTYDGLTNSALSIGFTISGGSSSKTLTVNNSIGLSGVDGKTLTVNNTLTLSGTDSSTLNIGTGGTLGTAAYTASTAYSPVAGSSSITTVGNITTGSISNLSGGNNTTLLGSIPYQSAINTTSLLSPNTTATQQFLSQTGTGTNGAVPGWVTLQSLATGTTTSSAISITNGTASTSSSTGALVVTGGVGASSFNGLTHTANTTGFSIAGGTTSKTLTVNNNIILSASSDGLTLTLGTNGSISNVTGGAAGQILYQSSANVTTFTTTGSSGQYLKCNGSLLPVWGSVLMSDLGSSPSSSTYLRGDGTWQTLGALATGSTTGSAISITNVTASTSSSTGALIVSGGVGITGALNLGTVLSVSNGGTGGITFAANNVLLGNGTSAFRAIAPGASGNVLTSNGTTWVSSTAGSSGATISDNTATSGSYYLTTSSVNTGSYTTAYTFSTQLYYTQSTGTLNATNLNSLSDIRKKDNIKTITHGMDVINQLTGVEFTWKENGNKSSGIIAQELEKVLPFLVDSNERYKTVTYSGLFGYVIEALKESNKEIQNLKYEISMLKDKQWM
jgi:hypothetical protein